jgi:peroxiredoxin Q/BCP
MVKAGDIAPDFEALDHNGETFRLSNLRGRYVVLYFYPKAMTSGCTREGIRFNELLEEFKKLGVEVVGASTDPVDVNRKFAEKYDFKFKLLSDTRGVIARAYGVLREDSFTAERTTFIIDPEGRIRAILSNIKPAEKHADEALRIVRELVEAKKQV